MQADIALFRFYHVDILPEESVNPLFIFHLCTFGNHSILGIKVSLEIMDSKFYFIN
jgi:hypothetical protein